MQLRTLMKTIREANPKFEDETYQNYQDRIYHLALMAWERTPNQEPDSEEEAAPTPATEPVKSSKQAAKDK